MFHLKKYFFEKVFELIFFEEKIQIFRKNHHRLCYGVEKKFQSLISKICSRGIVALDLENRKDIYHMELGTKLKFLLKGN